MLYVARVLGGISAAFIMPGVTAYVADITSIQERPKAMGYLSAAISTGFIIGPGIGGFIAEYGIRVPFFVAAAIAFIACVISIFILKEPLTKEELAEISSNTKESSFIGDLKKSLHQCMQLHLLSYLYLHSVYRRMKLCLVCFLIVSLDSHRKILLQLLQLVQSLG